MEDAYIEPELKVIVRSLKCVVILDSKRWLEFKKCNGIISLLKNRLTAITKLNNGYNICICVRCRQSHMTWCEENMTFEELKILRQLAMEDEEKLEEEIEEVVDVSLLWLKLVYLFTYM